MKQVSVGEQRNAAVVVRVLGGRREFGKEEGEYYVRESANRAEFSRI